MFQHNKNFSNKYNNGKLLPNDPEDLIDWIINNKENMKHIHKKFVELNTPREEILDFFSFHEKGNYFMIKNIEKKLSGELPVTREELITLVNSWGRRDSYENLFYSCKEKECYPLENLDVSQINDLSYVFSESYYNGDLSKWDISNVLLMNRMFDCSKFNNDSISKWNISNVKDFSHMFYSAEFDKDISSWQFNKDSYCYCIFFQNKNFEKKYNNGIEDIKDTNDFFKWFEENRDKIKEINTTKEKILEFFNFENNINLDKNI